MTKSGQFFRRKEIGRGATAELTDGDAKKVASFSGKIGVTPSVATHHGLQLAVKMPAVILFTTPA